MEGVLADGMIGLFVDFRKGGESPVKFFAELFYKKAGFWLLFSKSNITYKDFLILFLRKIP